jgi:hypothetical protein
MASPMVRMELSNSKRLAVNIVQLAAERSATVALKIQSDPPSIFCSINSPD